ncbi:uncharacterized protein LOC134786974 [Penaeus indicus]|uniref:uncharacterized protein LOC134786974 n=1 Tax=Penaeus indicus TaxID=29960 RepID=UPI00300CD1B5
MLVIVAVILLLWIMVGWLVLSQFHQIPTVATGPKSAHSSAAFHNPAAEVAVHTGVLKKDVEDKGQFLRQRLLNKRKSHPNSCVSDSNSEIEHLVTAREASIITKSRERSRTENSLCRQLRPRPITVISSGASISSDVERKGSSEISSKNLSREFGSHNCGVKSAKAIDKSLIIAKYLESASGALKPSIFGTAEEDQTSRNNTRRSLGGVLEIGHIT